MLWDRLVDRLTDIADQLRVHIQASPLDDIVEEALELLETIITELGDEL
jgi:hypothetical protein